MDTLPQDPYMLLSAVNMKLRDSYPTLDALCDDLDINRDELIRQLEQIDYNYDPATNRFA